MVTNMDEKENWGLSLDEYNEKENHNFLESLKVIKLMPEYMFYSRIQRLYGAFPKAGSEEYLVRSILVQISYDYFIISIMNLFRCHFVEALSALRNSIELAAYINIIKKENRLDYLFLQKQEKKDLFEKSFIANKFPEDDEVVFPLKERWKFVSDWASHMNFQSIHQKIRQENGQFKIGYFDLETENNQLNFRRQFNYILDTHIVILSVCCAAFEGPLTQEFRDDLFSLTSDYSRHKWDMFGKSIL